jgi:hypothetical protein
MVVADILKHFADNDLHPDDAWAFCDDRSSLGLDHQSPDGTKLWLDLNEDGTIHIFWKPAGAKRGQSFTFIESDEVNA